MGHVRMLDRCTAILGKVTLAISVIEVTIRTRSLTYARLRWRYVRTPKRVPGRFRFPFGVVHYIDCSSLLSQYQEIFVEGCYAVQGLRAAPVILDCGGNIGLSAAWFGRTYPQASITVYEADPAVGVVLKENIRRLRLPNIKIICAAVGDRDGETRFTSDGADGGRVSADEGITVPVVRLSQNIDGPVDLLKLDIEGSEYAVIADLCRSGAIAQVRQIVCEVHVSHDLQGPLVALWSCLATSGFKVVIRSARAAPHLPGPDEPTPFTRVDTAKYLLMLYAWRGFN